MMKIYVGCALHGTTKEFRDEIEKLKISLRQTYEVLDFVGLDNASPETIVEHDLAQVRACDIFLAITDNPSTGLGIEIGTANALNKKILLVAQDEEVSNMVRGNYIENKESQFMTYETISDIPILLKNFIN